MATTPLLNGQVDDTDLIVEGLRAKVSQLQDQLSRKDDEINALNRQLQVVEAGVRELRKVLTPYYRTLQKVFGEFDAMSVPDEGGTHHASPVMPVALSSRWDVIKQGLSGRLAEAIDILLARGRMTTSQLAAAMKTSGGNVKDNIVKKLVSQGLVVRDGREFYLKQL